MVFMLLPILFAIAIAMIFVGLRLSHKTPASLQREEAYVLRNNGMARRAVAVGPEQYRRRRRYSDLYEQPVGRATTRASVAATLNVPSFRIGKLSPRMTTFLIGLGVCFIVALFCFRLIIPNQASVSSMAWMEPIAGSPTAVADTSSLNLPAGVNASQALVRVAQMDPAQYASTQEYNTWAASACSATSMTEVIDSYGHNYRITDILQVESNLGQISPDLGLLRPEGIALTVAQFGFKTISFDNVSLDSLISIANQGRPVIVGFPPSHWAGGHLLVVTGGDANVVKLADSSQFHMLSLPRARFAYYWGGFAVVALPNTM